MPEPDHGFKPRGRFETVTRAKSEGATYTPIPLADFVAEEMLRDFSGYPADRPLRILDPAVGEGQLLISLLTQLAKTRSVPHQAVEMNSPALGTSDTDMCLLAMPA